MTGELRADVDAATALLAKAIQDPSYRTAERVELARIEGSFKYLSRSLEGFLATGEQTMAALVDGRREDARTASLGFGQVCASLWTGPIRNSPQPCQTYGSCYPCCSRKTTA